MGVQSIISIPSWAYPAVQAYSDTTWNLSQGLNIAPSIYITAGEGAVGVSSLTGGVVSEIDVVVGGQYYSEAPLVTIVPNEPTMTGSGATATATISGGVVTHFTVTAPGSGYLVNPRVIVQAIGSGATATATITSGVVTNITPLSGGTGYLTAPTVIISGGGGVGAVATANLTGSVVTSFSIISGGTGYGGANIQFAPYSGSISAPQDVNELTGISRLATRGTSGNATITQAHTLVHNTINGVGLAGLPATLTSTMNGKSTSSFLTIQALIGKKSFYIGDPRNPLAQDLTIDTASTYQGRLNAKLEDDNYRLERANQDAALGLGIELAKQSAINAETLRMAGLYMREYNQGTYELASKLFVEQEEFNVFKLEIFGNCLRAMTGSQQTTTSQDNQASGFMQAVGATTAVVGLYNVLSTATGTAVVGEAVASVGVTIWEALFGTVAIAAA